MADHEQAVRAFLEGWKPYAELAPGNAARRTINRFISTDDPGERERLLARANLVFQLHGLYEELGIRREERNEQDRRFRALLEMPVAEMDEAIAGEGRRDFLVLLQSTFEFGRSPLKPSIHAARRFLLDLWEMPVMGLGSKYSIYPNGVLFASQGLTHDELAKRFVDLGLGSGRPSGGGELQRKQELAFVYDTATTAFGGVLDPKFVADSIRRWVRLTGGQAERLDLRYQDKLTVATL
jgi:hypothetical protein